MVRGGDTTLGELIEQGGLDEDELDLAIYLGGQQTLLALVNQRQQLTKKQLALVRLIAHRRKQNWLLRDLDKGPEASGGGLSSDPDPGSGGPGLSPVGARPVRPPPGSLTASLAIPEDYNYIDATGQQLADKVDQPVR